MSAVHKTEPLPDVSTPTPPRFELRPYIFWPHKKPAHSS